MILILAPTAMRKLTSFIKKLLNLGIRSCLAPCHHDKVVHNFSSLCVSGKLKTVVAFGLDFKLPVLKLDFLGYFLPFYKLALSQQRNIHVSNSGELLPCLQVLVKK